MQVGITKEVMAWMEAVAQHGAITVDASGKGDLSPDVKRVIGALHEVLAGGRVDITVVRPGDANTRSDLDAKLQVAVCAANEVKPLLFAP